MEICEEVGAVFAATQFGSECWCSDSFDIMYDRHGDDAQACDIVCAGNKEEICGGFDAFNLYQLEAMNECHGVEVLPYEQVHLRFCRYHSRVARTTGGRGAIFHPAAHMDDQVATLLFADLIMAFFDT